MFLWIFYHLFLHFFYVKDTALVCLAALKQSTCELFLKRQSVVSSWSAAQRHSSVFELLLSVDEVSLSSVMGMRNTWKLIPHLFWFIIAQFTLGVLSLKLTSFVQHEAVDREDSGCWWSMPSLCSLLHLSSLFLLMLMVNSERKQVSCRSPPSFKQT